MVNLIMLAMCVGIKSKGRDLLLFPKRDRDKENTEVESHGKQDVFFYFLPDKNELQALKENI